MSPTFCHGVSGLLQITMRFAHDTGSPTLRAGAGELGRQLLSHYDPASRSASRASRLQNTRIDQPGLTLDGAAGVPLVALAAAEDVEPAWDRIFLLS